MAHCRVPGFEVLLLNSKVSPKDFSIWLLAYSAQSPLIAMFPPTGIITTRRGQSTLSHVPDAAVLRPRPASLSSAE